MARKNEVQYVNFYTVGSAAYKVEPAVEQNTKKAQLPKPRKAKRIRIYLDPMAVLGTVVAIVMLLMMVNGMVKLHDVRQQEARMEAYVQQLQQENAKLEEQYHAGYDPDEIYEIATAMGMIPAEKAQHVSVQVTLQEPEDAASGWENFCKFLAGLFA